MTDIADMADLADFIRQKAVDGSIALAEEQAAAAVFALPLADVETQALSLGILPLRFLRNGLSCTQQLRLLRAKVSVIGCGGLGGTVSEILSRLGVGTLRLVDPDCFEEHNLNRQRFSTVDTLGRPKVEVARAALMTINPVTHIEAVRAMFGETDVLASEIVVDALDSAEGRRQLGALCKKHDRPLVHGAVREWYGQVGIATAANDLIAGIYPPPAQAPVAPPAPRVVAPTVAAIASMQAAETCKLLLGLPSILTGNWLSCNLLASEYELIPSPPSIP